jgi:hypothetical protein
MSAFDLTETLAAKFAVMHNVVPATHRLPDFG